VHPEMQAWNGQMAAPRMRMEARMHPSDRLQHVQCPELSRRSIRYKILIKRSSCSVMQLADLLLGTFAA
jgi:hypothetical protein